MKDNSLVSKTEHYVKQTFDAKEGVLLIAHGFSHVDRVRKWSLRIAEGEFFNDLQIVEVTALVHDIGLPYIDEESKRAKHGEVGVEVAGKFLREDSTLTKEEIRQITSAIRFHSVRPSIRADIIKTVGEEEGKLIEIISDADMMDSLGAAGLMRAFTSKYFLPEYDPDEIKGETWGLTSDELRARFGRSGLAPVKYIIDQINQQIRYYGNLPTETAKQLAEPLVQYMKSFILQLERETAT